MRILVTSGGTKVDIDPVRYIMNMSKGTTGSRIAREALDMGHKVDFLTSDDGRTPFKIELDLNRNQFNSMKSILEDTRDFQDRCRGRYQEFSYRTYDDYRTKMYALPKCFNYGAIIMCAAVSDYTVDYSEKKAKSSSEMSIDLIPTEKIIDNMSEVAPKAKLVGFKLLNDCTEEELEEKCREYLRTKNLDMMVGNDLAAMRRGEYYQIHVTAGDSVKVDRDFEEVLIDKVSTL